MVTDRKESGAVYKLLPLVIIVLKGNLILASLPSNSEAVVLTVDL